jgi:O-antigen ligase
LAAAAEGVAPWIVALAVLAVGGGVKALPILLALFVLAIALVLGRSSWSRVNLLSVEIAFAAFAGYLAISASWSPAPAAALEKAGAVILTVAGVGLAARYSSRCEHQQLYRIARGTAVGFAIAVAFLATQHFTQMGVLNMIARHLRPVPSSMWNGSSLDSAFLNRSDVAAALLFWPVMLIMLRGFATSWRAYVAGLVAAGLLVVLYRSESQSAQVAFLLGLIAVVVAFLRPRWMLPLATSAWSLAVVAIVPLAHLLHRLGLQHLASLPTSFTERVAIWHATAAQVASHPLLGVGVDADRFGALQQQTVNDFTADHLGWHPHDLFLQVWHELGAVGAALLLVMGLLLLRRISRLQSAVQPFAYATFAAMSGIAAFGYGAWQSWLLALYAWAAILVMIGSEVCERLTAPRTTPPTT